MAAAGDPLDRSVGRINAALAEAGLAENTIVLFTSDNGGPGYIGLPDINHPFRGWKISQLEGGIRVPLFVKWPARITAGTVSEEPVAHIDMMPTLAAAAQAPQPDGVVIDGQNLLPLATGEGVEQWGTETLFWQSGHYRVLRHGDWKLQVAARPTSGGYSTSQKIPQSRKTWHRQSRRSWPNCRRCSTTTQQV